MKTLKTCMSIVILLACLNSMVFSQDRYTKRKTYPQWSLSGLAGVSFPVGQFGDNYKSGPAFGLDLSYKVNKEVGFFAKLGYSMYPNKDGGPVPDGKYIEYTVGPRYYFTSRNLKSAIFLEAGLGGYSFNQDGYVLDGVTVGNYTSTNFGMNAGIGGILNLGRDVDLSFKAKYHNILTTDGSTSFIEPVLGIDLRF